MSKAFAKHDMTFGEAGRLEQPSDGLQYQGRCICMWHPSN